MAKFQTPDKEIAYGGYTGDPYELLSTVLSYTKDMDPQEGLQWAVV